MPRHPSFLGRISARRARPRAVAASAAALLCASLVALAMPAAAQPTRGLQVVYQSPDQRPRQGLSHGAVLYERSHAVVVGIDAYRHLPRLQAAVSDARAVAQELEQRGMSVQLLLDEDATRSRLAAVLGDELPQRVGKDDRVLIYFAGHGVSTGSGHRAMGYLMPVEGTRDGPRSTGISMSELQGWLADYKSKHVLLVADACYSGLALSTRSVGLPRGLANYMRQVTSVRVRLALVAGRAGEVAHEHRGQGVFTRFFLDAIRGAADANEDGLVSSDEVAAYVKPQVAQFVAGRLHGSQNPQVGRLGEGDFLFLNPRARQQGELHVASTPPGAEVLVNGERLGVTPLHRPEHESGTLEVLVRSEGYQEQRRSVRLEAGGRQQLSFRLERLTGSLEVASQPPGAEVLVDGELWGTTPVTLEGVPVGSRRVRVRKQGYGDWEQAVDVTAQRPGRAVAVLQPASGILVVERGRHPGRLLLDGRPLGEGSSFNVPPGPHELVLQPTDSRYHPFRVVVQLTPGATHTVSPEPQPRLGGIVLRTHPAGAHVSIDDGPFAPEPMVTHGLLVGPHRVRAHLPGHALVEQQVQVTEGSSEHVSLVFAPQARTPALAPRSPQPQARPQPPAPAAPPPAARHGGTRRRIPRPSVPKPGRTGPGGWRVAAWSGVGLGVALGVTGAVVAFSGTGRADGATTGSDVDAGNQQVDVGNGLLWAGVGLTGACGIAAIVLTTRSGSASHGGSAAWTPGLRVGPGAGATLGMRW